ncbi:dihydrofolate reductase family protein [Chitinophaga sp. CC14]|uniref:dihydrofolate reductase family protein n=1 Tax=Chitinophaga TaxID=79328 RepID=UPI000DBAD229|nr:dihydrofolate reductase family protein [Chitinophaga ginsengisegetis]MDR6569990.1 dihydrofolate reductase [Chitinophaga ginsengisegetis]MDR6649723.1 dihydrofolate reductase [Chitinophaga ginsengisegetis]MDR6656074.1 dihydrofolate reductase [Chitinophaga ginsengisegetis]
MRKLIMKMSASLDGFVSDTNDQKDWVFKTGDEESLAWSAGVIREAGLIIMGRKSFETMAPYWPTATGPFAEPMNNIPKAVFTKKGFKGIDFAEQSPATASWAAARVFDGDLAEGIRALKAESGKPIVAIGGAGFMQNLIATGLIDEYHLAVHPVALGSGLPIFSALKTPVYLKLAEVKVFPKGIIAHTYHV